MSYLIYRKKRAFSFVEILIAIFIIGVGVLPVLTLFRQGTRNVESGGVIFRIAVAGQNIIDRVRSDTFLWEGLPVELVIPSDNCRGLSLSEELVAHYKAKALLKIDTAKGHTVADTGDNEENLYRIDLKITWVENGVNKEYTLTNYRANTNSVNYKPSTRFK